MGEFSFHPGAGLPVVGPPGRIVLAGAGGGQLELVGVDGDHPAGGAGGAAIAQWADAAGDAEPRPAAAVDLAGWADGGGDACRAGDRAGLQVDAEAVFAESAARRGGVLGFDHRSEPVGLQPGEVGAGAVGAVTVDLAATATATATTGGVLVVVVVIVIVVVLDQVVEQGGGDLGITGGGRAHRGRHDDLAVGVDGHMRLVAVKAVRGGLVPVAGLGIDGGDDAVRRGAVEDL